MIFEREASLEHKVELALAQIRPFLLEDGGDVRLVEITSGLVAKVALTGACKTCSMNTMTFTAGVEDAIIRAVPEIIKVEAVEG